MLTYKREIRGIPLWLLLNYLSELGGQIQTDRRVQGPGWTVRLRQMEDYRIGSLQVGQVNLELEAEPDVFERIHLALEKKLLRAGG